MPHSHPYPDHDLQEIIDRNHTARQLLTAFAHSTVILSDLWHLITAAIDDTPVLVTEIARLRVEMARMRLSRANLIAAAQATLSAHADGEADPLFYLRDELSAQNARTQPAKHALRDGGS
ncbi:hypothetical protein [Planobispora longispora]|uniref:Uncharacterized protein n=1 Tax=Planobispora longispora TaxID=28887 RepID=A0A8J3RSC0_9ACTN|nr:hypothetical protein [Planobispora longispora]BFE78538.1 hypothetical protein GCM10020093_011390 [Planobispora longispora]GIH79810.1 hypothetical protein Plo01_62390 [Planobispora longispora]